MKKKVNSMKVGLFFGSFNPIHIGHLIIANFMATQTNLDQVWFVVSPQNPFKSKSSLAKDYDRLNLVRLAVDNNPKLKASNIEFDLPKPSYTIDTLTYLKEKYPNKEFTLIMGGDNLTNFHKWKNYEVILEHYSIFVYKRPQYDMGPLVNHEKVTVFDAPLMQISASYVRKCISEGNSVQYLLPEVVYEYLESSSLYRKKNLP